MYRNVLAQKRTRLPQGGSRECVALVCMAAPKRGMKFTCSQCPKRKRHRRTIPSKRSAHPSPRIASCCIVFWGEPCPHVLPPARTGSRRGCVYVKEMYMYKGCRARLMLSVQIKVGRRLAVRVRNTPYLGASGAPRPPPGRAANSRSPRVARQTQRAPALSAQRSALAYNSNGLGHPTEGMASI